MVLTDYEIMYVVTKINEKKSLISRWYKDSLLDDPLMLLGRVQFDARNVTSWAVL